MNSLLTDPANHPANSPLAAERIERVIEALESSLKYRNGSTLDHFIADAVKGLRELRESREDEMVFPDEMTISDDMNLYQKSFAQGHNACRAAMLQGAEQETTAYKLPFEQWLSQQTGTIDVECGCVMTEVFFHWLRVAYEAGNSPVTPDGWQLVPKEPTVAMNKAGWAAINEHDEINPTYRAMLAAAPQQDVRLALEIGMSRYAGAMQKLVDSGD
ncbi:hypothetical protein [Kluyvera cryocrescens]|uniref:hypothetical protein n=1 Tax=Kluyvera cryocrescens TaxID=580 RepID=UPI000D9530BA|nr:hypothetical protein [Kluyvera cryocrescens]SQC33624.1 Uncharacterised protein [Kluyvera cryocrescens]